MSSVLYGAVQISQFLSPQYGLSLDPDGRNQVGLLLARCVHIEGAGMMEEEFAVKTAVKLNLEQDVLDLSQTALFQLAGNCLG